MSKFYVWSGRRKMVLQEDEPIIAATILCYEYNWRGLGKNVRVSEVGFDVRGGHPDHNYDWKIPVEVIRQEFGDLEAD